jgi:hypothetical protein
MDERPAAEQAQIEQVGGATPIFNVYRRGYDPEQVDRYVADQQRRLDEATYRASEAERKLAAAVGQLRELHRRVAVYESEARSAQPPALDTLGERVQRILQEAWEGAYNLRQEAEREVADLRQQAEADLEAKRLKAEADVEELHQVASREAAELVDEATRRALALRDEMERRRQAYLERVEQDRQKAVAEISYLYDQRELALGELARLQSTLRASVEEMVHSPLAKVAAEIVGAEPVPPAAVEEVEQELDASADQPEEPVSFDVAPLEEEVTPDVAAASYLDETLVAAPLDETLVGEPAKNPSSLFEQPVVEDDRGEQLSPEDIPTGPMEAVELGFGGYEPVPEPSAAEVPVTTFEPETLPSPPAKHGFYDAEEDGWA